MTEQKALGRSLVETNKGSVYAVAGPTAGTVAYNVAGLLAQATKDERVRTLLVDADGYVSRQILSGIARQASDNLVSDGGDLDSYLIHDTSSGLRALVHPEQVDLSADEIIERLRGEFDAVIVACGDSKYGEEWLRAADRAVVSAAGSNALQSVLDRVAQSKPLESLILAPMGRAQVTKKAREEHQTFELPSRKTKSFEESENSGEFATLIDASVGRAFDPLLKEMLKPAEKAGNEDEALVLESDEATGQTEEEVTKIPSSASRSASDTEELSDTGTDNMLSADDVVERMRRGARHLDDLGEREAPKPPGFMERVLDFAKSYWYYPVGFVVGVALIFFLATGLNGLFGGEDTAGVRDTGAVVKVDSGDGGIQEINIGGLTWNGNTKVQDDGQKVTTLEGPTAVQVKQGFPLPGGGGTVDTGVFATVVPEGPTVHATIHRYVGQNDVESNGTYFVVDENKVVADGTYTDTWEGDRVTREYKEVREDGAKQTYSVRFTVKAENKENALVPELVGWNPPNSD